MAGALGCVLVLLALPASAQGACAGATEPLAALTAADERAALRCLVGERRGARGLPRLEPSAPLRRMATELARDLARTGARGHRTADGAGLARRVRRHLGRRFRTRWEVGEVLAWTVAAGATPTDLFEALVASSPHRRILDDRRFRLADVGVAAGRGEVVAVVELARLR